jgi:hypothetical protein
VATRIEDEAVVKRRLALAAVLAAAVAAAIVVALVPGTSKRTPPPRHGISAHARIVRAALFGDILRANVDVLVDRHRVDPASVRLEATFGRWISTPPAVTRHDVGGVSRLTLAVELACVSIQCLPPDPIKRGRMLVRFPRAALSYDTAGGGTGRLAFVWPRVEVASRMTPIDMAQLNPLDQPPFHATESPAAVSYRISPTLLVWLLCAGGGVLLACAAVLGVRFGLRPAPAAVAEELPPPAPVRELTPLERALLLLERARERGGVPDQRRALEHLAGELRASGERELAGSATALAWAERPPGQDATGALAAAVQRAIDSRGNGHVEE